MLDVTQEGHREGQISSRSVSAEIPLREVAVTTFSTTGTRGCYYTKGGRRIALFHTERCSFHRRAGRFSRKGAHHKRHVLYVGRSSRVLAMTPLTVEVIIGADSQ